MSITNEPARPIDAFALSVLSENSNDGTIGFIRAVQLLATDTDDADLTATAIVARLAQCGFVTFDLERYVLTITPRGCEVLVLFETRTILMLAEDQS